MHCTTFLFECLSILVTGNNTTSSSSTNKPTQNAKIGSQKYQQQVCQEHKAPSNRAQAPHPRVQGPNPSSPSKNNTQNTKTSSKLWHLWSQESQNTYTMTRLSDFPPINTLSLSQDTSQEANASMARSIKCIPKLSIHNFTSYANVDGFSMEVFNLYHQGNLNMLIEAWAFP